MNTKYECILQYIQHVKYNKLCRSLQFVIQLGIHSRILHHAESEIIRNYYYSYCGRSCVLNFETSQMHNTLGSSQCYKVVNQ